MKFQFKAKIYKVGINPCVKVPVSITDKMISNKGYIPIHGKIGAHSFHQTLVSVKNSAFRLYVNGLMLKGAGLKVGATAKFAIEQNFVPKSIPMPVALRKKLSENGLREVFRTLTPYRQKEILKYLSFLRTKESKDRNIEKVIGQLKQRKSVS